MQYSIIATGLLAACGIGAAVAHIAHETLRPRARRAPSPARVALLEAECRRLNDRNRYLEAQVTAVIGQHMVIEVRYTKPA